MALGVHGGGKGLFLRCPKLMSGNFSRGSCNPDALTYCPPLSSLHPRGREKQPSRTSLRLPLAGHALDSSAVCLHLPPSPPSAATQPRPGRAGERVWKLLPDICQPPTLHPHPHPHSVGTCGCRAIQRPRTRTVSPGHAYTLGPWRTAGKRPRGAMLGSPRNLSLTWTRSISLGL